MKAVAKASLAALREPFHGVRVEHPKQEPRVSGDPAMSLTAAWPPIQLVHEILAKASMFDATAEQWNGVGHWPLIVKVWDKRRRSGHSEEERRATQLEKKKEKEKEKKRAKGSRKGGSLTRRQRDTSPHEDASGSADARVSGATQQWGHSKGSSAYFRSSSAGYQRGGYQRGISSSANYTYFYV